MTIEKMRRKSWYDKTIICNKDLHDGDLSLFSSSNNHKGKLKLTGDRSYVVNHINDTRVILLKTLEGDLFPGYIDGSQIKRFHAPTLT